MMKLTKTVVATLLLPVLAFAATDDQIDAAAQESERALQEQRQRESAQEPLAIPPAGLDATPAPLSVETLPPASPNCIQLERIQVQGARLMDEWDLEVLEAPLLGKCITPELATLALAKTTNYYLQRGFVTTRTYLPNQDLKSGVLTVFAAEGSVEAVTTPRDEPFTVENLYVPDVDLPLNIRDLEQAVDQKNAIPGNDVVMEIVPGMQPGASEVVFTNKGKSKLATTVSFDDSGSESVGVEGASVRFVLGDNETNQVLSVYYRESLGSEKKSSYSGNVNLAIPQGYNTYTLGYTKGGFNTILTFPITGTQLDNEGANESHYVSANRVIYRDQTSKHSLDLKLKRDAVESYIAGQLIEVSTRALTALELSSTSVWGFGSNVLVLTPQIAAGLSEVNNLPDGVNTPVENPQAEYLRYKLTADWQQPFELGSQSILWNSKFVGQHAGQPLYGSQQINVGGAASVRGSHFVTVSGDKGYYWQNTLTLKKAHEINNARVSGDYYLGYDFGRVRNHRAGQYQGGMSAGVLGAKWAMAPWSLAVQHSIPAEVSGRDEGDKYTTTTLSIDF